MSEEDAETSGLNGNADEQNVKKEGKSPEAEFDESQVESNTIEHPPPDVQDSDTGVKTETGELVGEAVHKSTFLTSGEEDTVEATAQADLPEDSRQDEASPKKTTFSNEVGNSTATVKILLMPEGHMMTMAFAIGLTVKELKYHFANELKVPSELIQISQSGRMVEDHRTLIELGVQPHGTIQLEMNSSDPENHPIRPVKPQQDYNMPDVITVRVQTETETFQDVVVEIERATHRKAFLGGYRHKATETEYHHAAVQTIAKRKPIRGVGTFSRDTQTVTVKSQSQQCTNSTSTQMTKIGCYVSNMEDKLISPGSYVTAAQYHSKRLRAVITLQMYTRRWQAKRMTDQLRQDREMRLAANARLVGKCRSCSELDNEARRREDFSHYKTILRRLRKKEQDLRYLVDVVWGAQSALSAWSDMHDLVMVRWDCQWEWSPWNCILLTKEEAAAHIKMENIEKAYGVVFIRNVKHKHTVAKKYFSKIPVMVKYLQDVDSQSAAHGNLLVAKPINTVTARILTTTPQAAGGKATQ